MRKREATTAEIREYLEQEHDCFPWCVHEKAVTLLNRIENLERRASFWETNYNELQATIDAPPQEGE